MRKIYLLLMTVFFIAVSLKAQEDVVFSFNSDGDSENWTGTNATVTVAGGILNMAFTGSSYPKLVNAVAGINADVYKYVSITLKNNTEDAYLRVHIPKETPDARFYFNQVITTNDAEFKTYIFNLTNDTYWVGTVDDIQLQVKKDAATVSAGVGSIDFDEIRFMTELPKSEQLFFGFETEGETEGWSPVNASLSVTGGLLTLVPTANKYAKMEQLFHTVDADVNPYFTIVCKNESVDDDMLRIIYTGGNYDIPLTMQDTYFKTYSVRVSDSTGWEGVQEGITLGFRDTENPNGVGKSSGTGNLIIESIEFSQNLILGTEDLFLDENPELVLYPSPANNILNIKTKKQFVGVEVIDLTGKTLLSLKGNVKTIQTANLAKGVYFLKMQEETGESSIKRFVKQ